MSTYQRNYSELEEPCLARLAGPLTLKTSCLCFNPSHVSLHFPLRTALGVFLFLVCLFHENSPPIGLAYICDDQEDGFSLHYVLHVMVKNL